MDASARDYESSPLTTSVSQPTFSSLLPLDAYDYAERTSLEDVTPLSRTIGIKGKDRELIVNEVHRIRHAKLRTRRRKLAAFSGCFTLVAIGCCAWFTGEAILAMLALPIPSTNWNIALAEVIICGSSVLFAIFTMFWLRYTRRPTIASKPVLFFAGLTVAAQLSLVGMNFILACVWRSELSLRCTDWGLDVVWTDNVKMCPDKQNPVVVWWLVAIALRFAISTIIGSLWMHCLIRFYQTLRVALIVPTAQDESLLQSSEVQTILANHSATIVRLKDSDFAGPGRKGSLKLPHMPEERHLMTDEEIEEEDKPLPAEPTGGWLWNTLGWLFGVNTTTPQAEQPLMQEQRKVASYTSSDVRMPDDLDSPPPLDDRFSLNALHPDYEPIRSPMIHKQPEQSFRDLLGSIGNRKRADSDSTVKRGLTDSSPPLDNQSFSNQSHDWREYSEDSFDDDMPGSLPGKGLRPSNSYPTHPLREGSGSDDENLTELPGRRATGTSSSNGQKVFVRMSDGRLVRKLSTIAGSERSDGDISRSTSSQTTGSLEQQLRPNWLPRL